jgi:hypothetical protein
MSLPSLSLSLLISFFSFHLRLFLVEGAPSVALALLAIIYLPDSPETVKFLTDDERRIAVKRLAAGNKFPWQQVKG